MTNETMTDTELPENPDGVLWRMQNMDDFQFEHLVADLWEEQGWNTTVSQQSADAGIDVTATKTFPYDEKALIQAKRYSEDTTVGSRKVQQYSALKQQEPGVDKVIIVTTGRFTSPAQRLGEQLNVKLIDGDDLMDLVYYLGCADLMDEYNLLPHSEPLVDETVEPHYPFDDEDDSFEVTNGADEIQELWEEVIYPRLIATLGVDVVLIAGLLLLGTPLGEAILMVGTLTILAVMAWVIHAPRE